MSEYIGIDEYDLMKQRFNEVNDYCKSLSFFTSLLDFPGTRRVFAIRHGDKEFRFWFKINSKGWALYTTDQYSTPRRYYFYKQELSFNEVLEQVSEEVGLELLFHLDIFA